MIDPFWNLLTDQQSQAIHQRVDLLGNHSLDTCRLKLIETVGTFIESLSEGKSRSLSFQGKALF